MQLSPHLSFDGRCEEAFRFYEKSLQGRILFLMAYRDSPAAKEVPPEWGDKILHATFAMGDQRISGSDTPPGLYRKPQGISLTLNITDVAEAERIFRELASDGAVEMPLQETFWALRFGMFTDKFGIPWMVNCARPSA